MKTTTSSSAPLYLFAALAIGCCAAPLFLWAGFGAAVALLAGAHQTLLAAILAAAVVTIGIVMTSRSSGQSPIRILRDASYMLFSPASAMRSAILIVSIGAPLTLFYLVALPAERFGALSLVALQFLTPGDIVAAILLGVGVPSSIALNVAAQRMRATQTTLTFGGIIAALLPSSLCCTTLIPTALATLGASAPAVMHTSGRYQSFFAQYASAFIGFAVAAVLFSVWLGARNLVAGCTTCSLPTKKSR